MTGSAFRPYPLPPDWQRRRAQVLVRDGNRCAVILSSGARCTEPANTVDHIIAVREGGTHELGNLQACCDWHHRKKTSAEGNRARGRVTQKRIPERHPGLIYDDE